MPRGIGRRGLLTRVACYVAVVLVLVLVPAFGHVGDYLLTLMISFFVYVILSESWNLMGGYTGQFNLGVAAYFGAGVFCYSVMNAAHLPFIASMLGAAVVAMALAVVIGAPTLRLKGIYFAVGTLALAEATRVIIGNTHPLAVYVPGSSWANFSLLRAYYIGLAVVVVTMIVCYGVIASRLGFAAQAIRDEQDAASSIGVNPAKYKLIIFIISALLAGLAGVVFAYYRGTIIPSDQFTADWTFGAIVASCIGGLGTLLGPILGSIVFVILEEVLMRTVGQAHFIVMGVLFIVVIRFVPGGLVQIGRTAQKYAALALKRKVSVNDAGADEAGG